MADSVAMLIVSHCTCAAGITPLMNLDRMVPGLMPTSIDERQFSGASDHSDSKASHLPHGSTLQCFHCWR